MLLRWKIFFQALIGLTLIMTTLGGATPTAPALADQDIRLPWYTGLVPNAGSQTLDQKPGVAATGPVSVVVHINISPLAAVAKNWNHQQRLDYVAKIQAAQDAVIPQIEGLGGQVIGRFLHLSAGLAVQIDPNKVAELRKLSNVVGVRSVNNYQLDLTETAPWIGSQDLQDLGVTGKGVDVAVLDSGVDYSHIKFGGSGTVQAYNIAYCGDATISPDPFDPNCTAHNLADKTGEFGDPNYGRDGNPINKVVGGWDWVGDVWPADKAGSDPNPIDFKGHGTHVADIIGGLESTPGAADAGVAPGANIWAYKVCSSVAPSCNGLALLLAIDDAMDLDDSDRNFCTPGGPNPKDQHCLDYDPADVINLSLGAPYGQPEDDLTLFAELASYYGSLVVAAAGNDGDRPYIVSSPSTANSVVSVAQSTMPSDKLYKITAGQVNAFGLAQPWAAPVTAVSGALAYDTTSLASQRGCSDANGASPWNGAPFSGKVMIMDRGLCANSLKVSNAKAAGAVMAILVNNSFSNTPLIFAYGGGDPSIVALTVTQNDGTALKTAVGKTASVDPNSFVTLEDDVVASSSRGPRVADGDIKPDIVAPGASVSAEVGTGTEKTAFGGTSGAAPMVSGAAALLIESLETRGLLNNNPGLDGESQPGMAPMVKTMLMNNANPNTYIGGSTANGGRGFLAPISLQGAGRVDVLAAHNATTLAWDVTDIYNWSISSADLPCTVKPGDVIFFILGSRLPDCADDFPFGNDYFSAWNSQSGSLSFGFDSVSATASMTRKLAIQNLSNGPVTYELSSHFRYNDDRLTDAVSLDFVPSSITVAAGNMETVDVIMKVSAKNLRPWTLDAGQFGASGTNIYCSNPNPQNGCPTLQMYEYDGFVTVEGENDSLVHLPWQILPKKAANNAIDSVTSSSIKLKNTAKYTPGDADVFSLMDISPNNCEVVDIAGNCLEENYVPGIWPGLNKSPVDIHEVGVRSYVVPGLNKALGLPPAPYGAIPDEVVDFAVTTYDAPYRASHNYPVEFDIYIDANRDGLDDYVVFNADLNLNASDGRNAVFVFSFATGTVTPYFYSFTDFNSQNWVLPVPAAAIGLVSTQPFNFYVQAIDSYFGLVPGYDGLWDCSPFDCGTYHTYQTGIPKFRPVTTALQVPINGAYTLPFSKPSGGAERSRSQIGLLFTYRDAKVSHESDSVTIP
jgi:subtilisin family serine protease